MGLLILFFVVSILFSFLCSIWEAVLLSIPPSYVEIKLQEGTAIGKRLKIFKSNIDRPLSAILTLNTIAHTVGAIGVGAQAGALFGDGDFRLFGRVLPFNGEAIIAALMTLAILILSEIIPKTLGANYWKSLTGFTVKSLRVIIFLLSPLVWLSQIITRALKKDKKRSVLSRADFTAMADIGTKQGIFEKNESKIIKNLLRFNTVQAKDIMTPRTVVKAARESMTIQEFYDAHTHLRFSRIPVYKDSKDNIYGFFLKDDLLANLINGNGQASLKTIMRNIMIVNEQFPIPDLFNQLIESREQIALVVDEFGGMAGLVTMEDVIETLLGMEIIDEMDNIEDMQMLARQNWERRARSLGLVTDAATAEEEENTAEAGINEEVKTSTNPQADKS